MKIILIWIWFIISCFILTKYCDILDSYGWSEKLEDIKPIYRIEYDMISYQVYTTI